MAPIFEVETPSSRKLTKKDYKHLRNFNGGGYGGDETVMRRGFAVKAPRILRAACRPEQDDPRAQFLYNNAGTQDFLLKQFPLLKTDEHQKAQAAKWAAVICHYFRLGWTDSRSELELRWEKGSVGSIVQQIRSKIKGLRRNGRPYSARKRGRPQKVVVLPAPDTASETPVRQAA
jgi:hypothetical protein